MNKLILIVFVLILTACSVKEPVETQKKPSSNGEGVKMAFDSTEVVDSIRLD